MGVRHHLGDLPADYDSGPSIAVDTETLGLNPLRDRLCVVQISKGDGDADVVQITREQLSRPHGGAPVLARVLADSGVLKLFHFARFDLAVLSHALGAMPAPIYCTKIASKLVRTYTDRHGLKDLLRELLQVEISKQQQSSDWAAQTLSPAQLEYAASDVLYLHKLKERLDVMLAREERGDLAQACFDFLPTRARLDLAGWPETDIFSHS
ncbi:MAG: ribonuclease D [Salinarimonas sp.]|nr:ribonuclease D [Salinarimonas sp.]